MKKIILVLSILFWILSLNGQIYTPNNTIQGSTSNNNVGIGTVSPGTKLEVNGVTTLGKSYYNILKISFSELAPAYFYIDTKIPFNDSPAPQIQITGYNYGHSNKAIKLTIGWYVYNNSFYWTQYKNELGYYNPSRIRLGTYNDSGTIRVRIEIANDGTYWSSYFTSATDRNGVSSNYDAWCVTIGQMPQETANIVNVLEYAGIVYSNSGNVGIGTTNPEAKLTVKGKILASEIQIKEVGVIPDYVFKPGYQLMTLNDVDDFVKQNQHLPDVPSEKDFKENGMNMAEMNTILLKKIEETTLYLIEQNKQIEKLKKSYEELSHENNEIKKLLVQFFKKN